jgi:hypothetical protein
LRRAAAVERDSEHTIAQGIVKNAEEQTLSVPKAEQFEAIPGRGVRAVVRWKFWAKPPAPHLANAETVMNGYTLACGPQVIAKYKDRSPSPFGPDVATSQDKYQRAANVRITGIVPQR